MKTTTSRIYIPIQSIRRLRRGVAAITILILMALACNIPTLGAEQSFEVSPGPLVTIQSPAHGSQIVDGDTVDFFAIATDNSGVVLLELWVDDVNVISQTSPDENGLTSLSLSYPLIATKSGTYSLIARAYNGKGESSDSAVHYIDVIVPASSTQDYAQYTVTDDDTLESIASKAGASADSIQQANPGLNGAPKAGQVILIPSKPSQPPAAAIPAAPNGNQQPGGNQGSGQSNAQPAAPGQVPPNLPGLLPVFFPINNIPVDPQLNVVPLHPSLFPNGLQSFVKSPSGLPLTPPSTPQASVDRCSVNLSWVDNSTNETAIEVFRYDPGESLPYRVASLAVNTTQYQDNVPRSGRYGYTVVAAKKSANGTARQFSSTVWVNIPTSTNCSNEPTAKRILFQPISFNNSLGLSSGFLNLTIDGYSAIRIPRGEQTSVTFGDWSRESFRWAIPLPHLASMKPGDSITIEFQGNGASAGNVPPVLLGQVQAQHSYESLIAADNKDKIWEAKNNQMTLTYKVWLEDYQYGGASVNPAMPPPTNVKLSSSGSSRTLTWDYDPQAKTTWNVDGFIVYSEYTCSGSSAPVKTINLANTQTIKLDSSNDPTECSCAFKVSAFSRAQKGGESKPSELTTDNCITEPADEYLDVFLKTYTVRNLSGPTKINLTVSANNTTRKSPAVLVEPHITYPVNDSTFGNSILRTSFRKGDSKSLQIGMFIPGVCQGSQVINSSQKDSWSQQSDQTYLMKTPDGNCELTFTLKHVPATPSSPSSGGSTSLFRNGDKCSLDEQCNSGACNNYYCVPQKRAGKSNEFCNANSQCGTGVCSCFTIDPTDNTIQNISCGPTSEAGSCSSGLPLGSACGPNVSGVCANFNCENGVCAPRKGLGQVGDYCHSDNQCATDFCLCPGGWVRGSDGNHTCKNYQTLPPSQQGYCIPNGGAPNGTACTSNDECDSDYCADGKFCAPRDGTGLEGDYCHHDNQCYSGTCDCDSALKEWGFCKSDQFISSSAGVCAPIKP